MDACGISLVFFTSSETFGRGEAFIWHLTPSPTELDLDRIGRVKAHHIVIIYLLSL